MKIQDIAQLCHETNRVYCALLGDDSQPSWDKAPRWQVESAIHGVEFHLSHPNATAAASHEKWLAEKQAAGWRYGPTKDPKSRVHPCFVPFVDLPKKQQRKDVLFKAIVDACSG